MLEAVWKATVIVKVQVYPQVHPTHSTAYYTTAKRIHYPSSLLLKLSRFYSALGDDTVSQMIVERRCWFEHIDNGASNANTGHGANSDGVMRVPWNQPIGLLCDIHYDDSSEGCDWLELKLIMTPTTTKMAQMDPVECTRHAFFNALKEAEAMRRTKQRRVMDMTKHEQQSLWDGVQSEHGSYQGFVSVVRGKILVGEARMAPVKVYDCRRGKFGLVRTAPVQLYNDIVVEELIGTVLNDVKIDDNVSIVTHGIVIDAKTRLLELMECLPFPDTMLHLTVHDKTVINE